jgi:DNA-binding LacI/PurR family transcriptional regulator
LATIADVARLAGVHPSTVSRVLRDDFGHRTSATTKTRIRLAAEELGYRPNALARALRTRRTHAVALLAPYLDNLGFVDVARGVLEGARDAGLRVMLMVTGPDDDDTALREFLAEGHVDGLLVAFATLDDPRIPTIVASGIPYVLVNRRARGISGSIVVNDIAAAGLAVDHLVELGHRRIGHISGAVGTDTAARREEGFRAGMARHGLPVDPRWVATGAYREEQGAAAARTILTGAAADRPTALLAADLVSALGALEGIRGLGLSVPVDLSIVALDDHFVAGHTNPPLTTVRMPHRQMGAEAVGLLATAIAHGEVGDVVIDDPARLIIRGSSAAPPTGGGT